LDKSYCGNCRAEVTSDMNFCPRCGAPFKTTAQPVPIVNAPINSFSISELWAAAVIYVFLGFLWGLETTAAFHLPIIPVIALAACGALVGVYATRKYTLHQLAVLDAKGEIKTSQKKTIIFILILGAAAITAITLIFMYETPNLPSYWPLPTSLIYPLPTVVSGTRAFMYSKWQKERHKQIFYEKKRVVAIPKH